MFGQLFTGGLALPGGRIPRSAEGCPVVITDEAGIAPAHGEELRVEALVAQGDLVAQGQPVLRTRGHAETALTAPMAGRVASVQMKPGRRLSQLVLFAEAGGGRHRFAVGADTPGALRRLMQESGLWRMLRSRPFGHMPTTAEHPAAIFVMATDSRPGAPDPAIALDGRAGDLARGIDALATLCDALFLCETRRLDLPPLPGLRRILCGRLHPQGLAGIQIHRHRPAAIGARVWDIHAEDVADLGTLLETGLLPETRLVSVTGNALRETRLLRCQPGADLRALSQGVVRPGPHQLLSGSVLDGQALHWLGPRDRQVTALPRGAGGPDRHWFGAALKHAARPLPIIPTAALDQAMGSALPAAALVRALASGDQESAVRLGALSLLEEDLALADYATRAEPALSAQLRILLDRIEDEEVPA